MSKRENLRLPDAIHQEITKARSNAGKFYAFSESETPLLIQSQDGTSSGKTYNVFYQYIQGVNAATSPGNGHRNLVFITPLKSQIDIPSELVELASSKQILILPYLSLRDVADLSFTTWVKQTDRDEKDNQQRYFDWIHTGCNILKDNTQLIFERLRSDVQARVTLELRLKAEVRAGATDEQVKIEEELLTSGYKLTGRLQEAAIALLNTLNTDFETLLERAGQDKLAGLAVEMVKHLFPFHIALYRRCILLATTKKFDGSVLLLKRDNEGIYHKSSQSLDHVLGQKKHQDKNPLEELTSVTSGERLEKLKQEYWVHDSDSPYAQRDIRFTLVLDEEHEAYKIFQQTVCKILLNDDLQLPSILATLHRVLEYIDECRGNERAPGYEPLDEYVCEINNALLRCDLRPDFDLKKMTQLFSNNMLDVVVDSRNTEQVIALIGNVFSYQIQRFYREDDLRHIRLRSHGRQSYTEIYVSAEDDEDAGNDFSLYELYQTITAILAASAKLKNPSRVQQMLSQQDQANQNNPLSLFIGKAQQIKGEASYLLSGSSTDEQLIDDFFTYFQPKTLFSLAPREKVIIESSQLKGWVLLKFRMELIKELPEVALLRVLYQTHNTVILLSATAGFPGTYNGQYSRPFLADYAYHLGYQIKCRDVESAAPLATIRKLRNIHRPVNIEIFDDQKSELSPLINDPIFKKVLKIWEGHLEHYLTYIQRHRYHKREFHRELQAMLLAAYTTRHTLCIGLSARFFTVLGKFLQATLNSSTPMNGLKILDTDNRRGNDTPRVFEITPFDNLHTLRVVMFDSKLNREDPVRDYLRIDQPNLTLFMISHFKGAGTGLNYYIAYPETDAGGKSLEVDFDELAMVCDSFWSQVNAAGTRNTLENYVTLLKHYAHGSMLRRANDFETDLVDSDAARMLDDEHIVELHKVAMQTIGRTERRDAKMQGTIKLPSGVHLNAIRVFRDLARYPDARSLLASLSLHNNRWFEKARHDLEKASFNTDKQRTDFEQRVLNANAMYKDFEVEFVEVILKAARTGDKNAIQLNEDLRHPDSFQNPQKYINRLKRNPIIKNSDYIKLCVENFFLERTVDLENIILARTIQSDGLTDISAGSSPYEPERCLPQYHEGMSEECGDLEKRVFPRLLKLESEPLKRFIPIPALIPLLIGNIGEWQFHQVLKAAGIKPLAPEQIILQLGSECYELFDIYLIKKDHLFAIDVKNWMMGKNNRDISKRLHTSALNKVEILNKIVSASTSLNKVSAVYLNTRHGLNCLNDRAEKFKSTQIFYFNLLKVVSYYEKDISSSRYESKINRKILINRTLMNMLGYENE
ncbi:hypothetical protein [Citrobacter youngae]|uniref:hypothetical protein n=1 Tax=Citrobacter youngae TaxID=133448 RepID=UPI00139CDD59|nr:hypothetical protein [Citrobacter youngae]